MCGFVFTTEKEINGTEFLKALDSIFHRGPDDVKMVESGGAWLGFWLNRGNN